MLLSKEKITVQPRVRTVGSLGKITNEASGDSFTIWGSVVPMSDAQLERNPELARKSARWLVFTEGKAKPFEIRPAPPTGAPPLLTTSQGELIPVRELDYSSASASPTLPGCTYACAEISADEPSR